MIDFTRCRLPPFQHQKEDVAWLVDQRFAFIASEMRTGKSKIVVDAAQVLFERGLIDKVIVVAPAPVRDVWADQTLGEISKHAWADVPNKVIEYHARIRTWENLDSAGPHLAWFCTNYEFLRSKNRLAQLMPACGPRTLLVGDESSFLKNPSAQQTKAFAQLRRRCGRVVLLNGTPIFHSPLDLFSQGNLLDPSILDCKYITLFKARYAVQQPVRGFGGRALVNPWGKPIMEVTGWTNLDDLERRFKPYTVRRMQAECLDLPPKLDPVTLTATLGTSWPHYKAMRDDLVVWLTSHTVAVSATAAIKAVRLSQITGGFLGGVEDSGIEAVDTTEYLGPPGYTLDELDNGLHERDMEMGIVRDICDVTHDGVVIGTVPRYGYGSVEVGREKLDVLLWFIEQRLEADPNLHLVAWTRYRAEAFRTHDEVKKRFPQFQTAVILGGQKKAERLAALALLKPETSPAGPVFVCGIEGTGSFGLDMTAAHTCVTMSSGYSPGRSAQTLDRVYGPGQVAPVAYYNIVATGPKGQRTIDHDILQARLSGEVVAQRTSAAWIKKLSEE